MQSTFHSSSLHSGKCYLFLSSLATQHTLLGAGADILSNKDLHSSLQVLGCKSHHGERCVQQYSSHHQTLPSRTGARTASPNILCKVGVCLSLHSKTVFQVFQGHEQPASTVQEEDSDRGVSDRVWQQANESAWSVLFLTTAGSANKVVKSFEGKRAEDRAGNGWGCCRRYGRTMIVIRKSPDALVTRN